MPQGYLPVGAELVFEVRSPGDRWGRILGLKIGEYLEAGVKVVCVLDQMTDAATSIETKKRFRSFCPTKN